MSVMADPSEQADEKPARRAARELMSEEFLDRLMARVEEGDLALTGEGGFLPELVKAVLERGLDTELTDHLGYERGDPAASVFSNSRNGSTPKTLQTEVGALPLPVPEPEWRPERGFATRPGWLAAILDGHRRVAGGLDVGCPALVLLSARSTPPLAWDEDGIDDPHARPCGVAHDKSDAQVMDLVAVRRALSGEAPSPALARLERRRVVEALAGAGFSDTEIATRVGASTRTIQRVRHDRSAMATTRRALGVTR